jgi:hypothetical protein
MPLRTRTVLIAMLMLVAIGTVLSWWVEPSQVDFTKPVASEYSNGACESNGITLVVDFGTDSDMAPLVRCVKNFSGSGWDLFQAAQIAVTGTKQYPVGFVCQVENFPLDQNCQDTPTYAEGTWSYFFISGEVDDAAWKISGIGAAARQPECGSVEGWRFLRPGEQPSDHKPTPSVRVVYCDG